MKYLISERLWLYVALIAFAMIFESWSVLEVKSDEVILSRISFWCYKSEIKKIKAIEVGEVEYMSFAGKGCPYLSIRTKREKLFCELSYGGILADVRLSRDVMLARRAIANGTYFKTSVCESLWAIIILLISSIVYIYKRAWRLEWAKRDREWEMRKTERKEAAKNSYIMPHKYSSNAFGGRRYITPSEESLQRDYNPILSKVIDIAYQKAKELIFLDGSNQKIKLTQVMYVPFFSKLYLEPSRDKFKGCRWVWRVSFAKQSDQPKHESVIQVVVADSAEMEILRALKTK